MDKKRCEVSSHIDSHPLADLGDVALEVPPRFLRVCTNDHQVLYISACLIQNVIACAKLNFVA